MCGAARDAWCVVRGAWYLARGAWRVVRGAWRVVHGAWCMARGAWRFACGVWCGVKTCRASTADASCSFGCTSDAIAERMAASVMAEKRARQTCCPAWWRRAGTQLCMTSKQMFSPATVRLDPELSTQTGREQGASLCSSHAPSRSQSSQRTRCSHPLASR